MEISKTGKVLFTMANSARRTSRGIEEQIGYAPSNQAMSSLTGFLEKETQKPLSNNTRINAARMLSGMEYGMSSLYQNPTIKIRSGIYFYISIYFPWTT